jgi:hypothetical protein
MFSMLGFSVLAITLLSAAQAGHQGNSLMAVRADGKALALACTDAGKIAALDAFSMRPLWETGVGSRPEGTTFVGPGKDIAATVYDEDLVVILDGEKGSLRFKIPVEDEPYGIISNGDGSRGQGFTRV